MSQKNLQIKGINRRTPKNLLPDAPAQEIVNLRPKQAGWELMGDKPTRDYLSIYNAPPEYFKIFIHKTSEGNDFVIGAYNNGGEIEVQARSVDTNDVETLVSKADELYDITAIGNVVVILFKNNVYKFLRDKDAFQYIDMSEFPEVQISAKAQNTGYSTLTDADYEVLLGKLRKFYYEKQSVGETEGHILIRAAYRLYDDTFVGHSNIFHVWAGEKEVQYSNPSDHVFENLATGFVNINYSVPNIENYKGIIKSICFFITRPEHQVIVDDNAEPNLIFNPKAKDLLSSYPFYLLEEISLEELSDAPSVSTEGFDLNTLETRETLSVYNNSRHLFTGKHAFRYNNRIHLSAVTTKFPTPYRSLSPSNPVAIDISFASVSTAGQDATTINVLDISWDVTNNGASNVNVEYVVYKKTGSSGSYSQVASSSTAITVDAGQTKTLTADFGSGHEFNDTETPYYKFLLRYDGVDFKEQEMSITINDADTNDITINTYSVVDLTSGLSGNVKIWQEVILDTQDGEKRRISQLENLSGTGDKVYLGRVITYPDIRASKIKFHAEDTGTGDIQEKLEISLKKSTYYNVAYYANDNGNDDPATFNYEMIEIDVSSISGTQDLTETPIIHESNRLQVSAYLNPFVYAPENSYRIGDDENELIATQSVAMPVSEGQFGDFPLYVFTANGIWLLGRGQGEVLYASKNRINKDQCLNSQAIVAVKGSIIYATKNGVKIITGRDSQEISLPLQGEYSTQLPDHADQYIQSGFLSGANFIEYLQKAILAYDYFYEELVLFNPSLQGGGYEFPYTYIYSFKENMWFKMGETFDHTFYDEGEMILYRQGSFIALNEETSATKEFLYISRPIDLEQSINKIIERSVIRGEYIPSTTGKIRAVLYGSENGKVYALLRGNQNVSIADDIHIKRATRSCKYMIIVISGEADKVIMERMDFNYQPRYTNQLR